MAFSQVSSQYLFSKDLCLLKYDGAAKDIEAGEELLFDYGNRFWGSGRVRAQMTIGESSKFLSEKKMESDGSISSWSATESSSVESSLQEELEISRSGKKCTKKKAANISALAAGPVVITRALA